MRLFSKFQIQPMRTEKSCLMNSYLLEASIKPPFSGQQAIFGTSVVQELLSLNLFNLNDWIDEANSLRKFRLRCYQAGNLEAIYMRYVMLNLAFSVDARGFVHNYPSFSLEFVDRMNYMYDFGILRPLRINPNVSHDCWCSAVIEPMELEHSGHEIVVSGNVQLGTSAMIFT
ncbi:hypothetical protein HID58_013361 [Brassica napus]|uniref:Uncharacterized protein n=1 Tax=Brassica napus TaxID=3708 RepID=A0ABQ8E3N5_BRANA|nr:hypothetical protein HID58_013361 [Brassica napus]